MDVRKDGWTDRWGDKGRWKETRTAMTTRPE